MVCAVHRLSKFRPNPNQRIQLKKLLINQIHKPQTAIKTHLVTILISSLPRLWQRTYLLHVTASSRVWELLVYTQVLYQYRVHTELQWVSARHSQPKYSGTASGAFVPLCLCPVHDVFHVGQLEGYCLSSVSKIPLVYLFYQFPWYFLVSSNVFILFSLFPLLRILPLLFSFSFVISSYFSLSLESHSLPFSLLCLCVMIFYICDSCGLYD